MFGGVISDRTGSRKVPLLICIAAFSFCSVLSGMAATFATLLAARLLMGIAEGPILPISQSLVAEQSSREDRGHNMGITQTAGSALLGSFLAPIILVPIAQKFGWSGAMYLAAVPGLLMAALVWKFVREPTRQPRDVAGQADERTGLLKVLAFRNVRKAYGDLVVMEEMLPAALAALFKESAPVAGLPAPAGSSPSGPADERARQALADYDRALDRLRAGDWAGFGAELDALRPLLEELSRQPAAR
jgi:MFS family permease